MAKKALVIRKATPVAINRSPAEIIQSVLASKGATIETLKEMLSFQKDWEANEAKKAYYKAITGFKANLPQIVKDKKANYAAGSSQIKYGWASLSNITEKVNPELSKFGLSAAWFQKQTEKTLTVTCRITHQLGYSEETSLTAAADETGSKNDLQALGSSNAYLERYTFLALLGVAARDQDDDGRASGPVKEVEKINEKQLGQLFDLIDNNNVPKPKFLAYLKIAKLEDLAKDRFEKTLTDLNNIIKTGKP